MNLKGTEVLRLLKTGRVRLRGGAADLRRRRRRHHRGGPTSPASPRSFTMSREITRAWMPEMQKVMKERHNSRDPGDLHLPAAEVLLPRRHQGHRGPQGQEDPRAGRLAGRSRQGVRRLRRHDPVRRGGAGAREGRRRLRHHRHHAGLQGQVARGDQDAVPPAGRLHGRPLGRQPQQLEQALQPTRRSSCEKQFKALEDKSWKIVEDESTEEGVACNTGRRPVLGRPARQAQARQAVGGRPRGARQGAQRGRAGRMGQALRRRLRRQVDRDRRQAVRARRRRPTERSDWQGWGLRRTSRRGADCVDGYALDWHLLGRARRSPGSAAR